MQRPLSEREMEPRFAKLNAIIVTTMLFVTALQVKSISLCFWCCVIYVNTSFFFLYFLLICHGLGKTKRWRAKLRYSVDGHWIQDERFLAYEREGWLLLFCLPLSLCLSMHSTKRLWFYSSGNKTNIFSGKLLWDKILVHLRK